MAVLPYGTANDFGTGIGILKGALSRQVLPDNELHAVGFPFGVRPCRYEYRTDTRHRN
jgi:hypothetical protein